MYGHVIAKFSGMGRFTYPWCSAGTHESSANNNALKHASEDVYFLVFTEFKVVKTNLMAREYTINKVYYYCYGIINITRAWLINYKVQWTVITNCENFFISKCDRVYYNLRRHVLPSWMIITNCDGTYRLPYFVNHIQIHKCLTAYPTIGAESISAPFFSDDTKAKLSNIKMLINC